MSENIVVNRVATLNSKSDNLNVFTVNKLHCRQIEFFFGIIKYISYHVLANLESHCDIFLIGSKYVYNINIVLAIIVYWAIIIVIYWK